MGCLDHTNMEGKSKEGFVLPTPHSNMQPKVLLFKFKSTKILNNYKVNSFSCQSWMLSPLVSSWGRSLKQGRDICRMLRDTARELILVKIDLLASCYC